MNMLKNFLFAGRTWLKKCNPDLNLKLTGICRNLPEIERNGSGLPFTCRSHVVRSPGNNFFPARFRNKIGTIPSHDRQRPGLIPAWKRQGNGKGTASPDAIRTPSGKNGPIASAERTERLTAGIYKLIFAHFRAGDGLAVPLPEYNRSYTGYLPDLSRIQGPPAGAAG